MAKGKIGEVRKPRQRVEVANRREFLQRTDMVLVDYRNKCCLDISKPLISL